MSIGLRCLTAGAASPWRVLHAAPTRRRSAVARIFALLALVLLADGQSRATNFSRHLQGQTLWGVSSFSGPGDLTMQDSGESEDARIYVDGAKYSRDSAGINRAIADLLAGDRNGGDVWLSPGIYSISSTVQIRWSNVRLFCAGGSVSFNTSHGACLFNWTGPVGNTVINIDTANRLGIGGDALDGITVNCASMAGTGIRIYSQSGGSFKNLQVFDCRSFGVDLGVNPAVDGTSGLNSQNVFENINSFTATVDGMTAWRLTGTATYDTAGNSFVDVAGSGGKNGDGFRLENADNDRWYEVNGAASGTGYPLHLTCMVDASSQNMCAREETFYGVNLGPVGVKQDGKGSYFATSNRIYGYELCNGSPLPSTSVIRGTALIDTLDCGDANFATYYFTNQGGSLYRIYSQGPGKALNWLLVPSGYAGWTFGTGPDRSFEVFDAGAPGGGLLRFGAMPAVAGNAETDVQSVGVGSVSVNSEPNAGTGGLSVYSGGTSPSRVAWLDGLGNGRFKGAIADQGAACTNGELRLGSGWGSAALVSNVAGTGQTCEWTITASGPGIGANPTIIDTLTNVLPNAVTVCEMRMVGGTGTAALIDQTTLSATAPGFTFSGTPLPESSYRVLRRCGP
jgi:hypothetical protein